MMNGRRTHSINPTMAAALILGASLMGGCATSHVGNAWQCPLVQGSVCARVAEADPASPWRIPTYANGAAGAATEEPATRVRGYRNATGARWPAARAAASAQEPESICKGDCRVQDRRAQDSGAQHRIGHGFGGTVAESSGAGETAPGVDDPPSASLPSASLLAAGLPSAGLLPARHWRDGARTAEVIGRIWIAPYVDEHGIYHEAGWVRVVIEPAGWSVNP